MEKGNETEKITNSKRKVQLNSKGFIDTGQHKQKKQETETTTKDTVTKWKVTSRGCRGSTNGQVITDLCGKSKHNKSGEGGGGEVREVRIMTVVVVCLEGQHLLLLLLSSHFTLPDNLTHSQIYLTSVRRNCMNYAFKCLFYVITEYEDSFLFEMFKYLHLFQNLSHTNCKSMKCIKFPGGS